jgi:hypothetical protein
MRRVALRVVGDGREDIDLTFSAPARRAGQIGN